MRDLLWVEIDLKQIVENAKYIERYAGKKLIPVVKSNAYNLGLEVVKYLTSNLKLDYLAVVDFTEAIKIIDFHENILILNSLNYHEYQYLNQYPNIVISINKLSDIIYLNNIELKRKVKVHLQVDTGMNRLGFKDIDEYKKAIQLLKENQNVLIEGIYTHFSSKENALNQLEKFKKFESIEKFSITHLAATSTYKLIDYGNYVRVGLDLYGITNEMQSVKVCCYPLEIRKVYKGETVGYSELFVSNKDTKIAILPIGYANGLTRKLKGYTIYANDKLYKIVGNICMNHVFIEVDDSVNLDTKFIITSKDHPIVNMAKHLDTTPHEILCMFNIQNRIYLKD